MNYSYLNTALHKLNAQSDRLRCVLSSSILYLEQSAYLRPKLENEKQSEAATRKYSIQTACSTEVFQLNQQRISCCETDEEPSYDATPTQWQAVQSRLALCYIE
ncbi:Hypothetical_protein [Hexamita inflata]|uniref:Hypothetical_protein n=1 Tax=Hexamita inflata TaxID=28002 RepID=A0AA86TMM3_9EUKA|nr:Hypothetical protein HINF_LOCUS10829 [Hexamita inflata]